MSSFWSRYRRLHALGHGTYGEVWKCVDLETKSIVAVKCCKMNENGIPQDAVREVAYLKALKPHPNVVTLLDSDADYADGRYKSLCLVFEYMEQDMAKYLERWEKYQRDKPLDPILTKVWMYQILRGLKHCHANRVMIRDLKPANILIRRDTSNLKLADFGLAHAMSPISRCLTEKVVTLWYRAPELLLGCTTYDASVDMWSAGCIFAYMLRGFVLFRGKTELDQLCQIFEVKGTPTETTWPEVTSLPHYSRRLSQPKPPRPLHHYFRENCDPLALDLLASMLRYEPHRRVTAAEALNHEYFAPFRKRGRVARARTREVAPSSSVTAAPTDVERKLPTVNRDGAQAASTPPAAPVSLRRKRVRVPPPEPAKKEEETVKVVSQSRGRPKTRSQTAAHARKHRVVK